MTHDVSLNQNSCDSGQNYFLSLNDFIEFEVNCMQELKILMDKQVAAVTNTAVQPR